jgi:hypothetical protein
MAKTADGEQYLSGGTMTPVVRVGATVRRATGPWSCRVHQLLRHLADAGFDGAPRYLGTDPQGREILSFIDGEVTAEGTPVGLYERAALTGAAQLLRRFHDATTGFAAAHAEGWQIQIGSPTTGPVICHNEIGPYNTVYRNGSPFAFIDWDFAALGQGSGISSTRCGGSFRFMTMKRVLSSAGPSHHAARVSPVSWTPTALTIDVNC